MKYILEKYNISIHEIIASNKAKIELLPGYSSWTLNNFYNVDSGYLVSLCMIYPADLSIDKFIECYEECLVIEEQNPEIVDLLHQYILHFVGIDLQNYLNDLTNKIIGKCKNGYCMSTFRKVLICGNAESDWNFSVCISIDIYTCTSTITYDDEEIDVRICSNELDELKDMLIDIFTNTLPNKNISDEANTLCENILNLI